MRIIGLGVDLAEIERVQALLEKYERFPERIFTAHERAYASRFAHPARRYAARFARSAFLDRGYKEKVFRMVAELKQKHSFSDESESEIPAALHETEAAQLPLLQIDSETKGIPCVGTPPRPQRKPHTSSGTCS